MPKLTPKINLEGTRLTFKTDIAFALNEHPRVVGPRKYKYHSPLISGEWCAFTNFPWVAGINFRICYAGLQEISAEILDAPVVDGAASFRRFRSIELLLLRPTMRMLVLLSFIY